MDNDKNQPAKSSDLVKVIITPRSDLGQNISSFVILPFFLWGHIDFDENAKKYKAYFLNQEIASGDRLDLCQKSIEAIKPARWAEITGKK